MDIFLAVIFVYILMVVADALHMKMVSRLVSTFIDVGVLALIVIFQPEIRHMLMRIGKDSRLGERGRKLINRLTGRRNASMMGSVVNEITEACRTMSAQKTGALIVISHDTDLEYVLETGDRIDAAVSHRLLMNLFFKNSPLHDGAVIITDDRIAAARCTLPITDRTDIPARYGMRHRAAIGLSEETDADIVVVSEETGEISFVRAGSIKPVTKTNELKLLLSASVGSFNDREKE
mgnify:CR=1 FL=1